MQFLIKNKIKQGIEKKKHIIGIDLSGLQPTFYHIENNSKQTKPQLDSKSQIIH